MIPPIYIDNSIANNKVINSTGNRITVYLNNTIVLDQNKRYEIGLYNSSIVYCHPNVVNLNLKFSYLGTDYVMPMKNGLYSLDDLNIAFTLMTNSLYEDGLFYIEGIESTMQVAIFANDYVNTEINFDNTNNDNVLSLLGFSSSTTKFQPTSAQNYYLSQNKAQLNNISNFFINVDNTNSFVKNGSSASTIYVSPIDVKPAATQRINPYNIIYCGLNNTVTLDSITLSVTGDNNQDLDMTGGWNNGVFEKFSATLILREVKD